MSAHNSETTALLCIQTTTTTTYAYEHLNTCLRYRFGRQARTQTINDPTRDLKRGNSEPIEKFDNRIVNQFRVAPGDEVIHFIDEDIFDGSVYKHLPDEIDILFWYE